MSCALRGILQFAHTWSPPLFGWLQHVSLPVTADTRSYLHTHGWLAKSESFAERIEAGHFPYECLTCRGIIPYPLSSISAQAGIQPYAARHRPLADDRSRPRHQP